MTTFGARAALVCAFLSSTDLAAQAQRSPAAVGALDHASWGIREGAPTGVSALAQSPDGLLWIGTTTGLYQFDGVAFEPFERPSGPVMPSLSVNTLLALPDGRVWVGYSRGGASVLTGRNVVSYAERDGLPVGTVTALAVDSTGDVWAATTTGLARFRRGRWQRMGAENDYPRTGMTSDLVVDRRGALWAATSSGVLVLRRGERRFVRQAPSLDPTGGGGGVPREAPDGSVWGASLTLGLTRLSDSTGGPVAMRPEADGLREGWGLIVDHRSNAWVMDRLGLVRVPLGMRADAARQSEARRSLPLTRVRLANDARANALFEDREGSVWVGTNAGLDRFRETKLTPVTFPVPVSLPSLVAGDSGSMWVGGEPELFSIGDSVQLHRGAPLNISCAYRDLDGGVWLGGWTGVWYAPRREASSATRFSPVPLPPDAGRTGDVQAIAKSANGDLWVSLARSVGRGVFRRHEGKWTRVASPPGLEDQYALVIVTDSAGRSWLGYPRNRVVLVAGDSTRIFSEADGLHVGVVAAMFVRGSRLWIGGESGVMVLDGQRFRPISATVGLRAITGIVETASGDLWVSGAGGITHIDSVELRRSLGDPAYQAHAERFDYHDGLNGQPPQIRPLPTVVEGTDGRLWFATESGVAWLDPANIRRNRLPPPVQVRVVSAGGRRYDPDGPIALPAGTSEVQIAYTAASLAVPDRVRFRYRLAGTDTAWQEPGGRREAYYTNLSPGSYRFQVVAANEDGVWNESGATVELTIPPTFAQSRWFLALWAGLLAGAAWLVYRLRMRQVAAGLRARYEAALTERTRIAQELHDTLLQGFTGITIQLRAIQRMLGRRPEEGVAALEAALTTADTTLRDARNTIWDMRAVELDGHDLPEALEGAVRSVLTGAPIALDFTVRGERRPLTPHIETTALRIVREAVLNALKHANARMIAVRLGYEADLLHLEVRDDGDGLRSGAAEAAAADGHLGIPGMRARAHRAAGTLEVASEPGRGTTVRVALPIGS